VQLFAAAVALRNVVIEGPACGTLRRFVDRPDDLLRRRHKDSRRDRRLWIALVPDDRLVQATFRFELLLLKRSETGLVVEHLENISRTAIKRYPEIITDYARRRSRVYALYKGEELYYVGLAKNLRSRLHGHLKDRHAEAWDRFSVYLTRGDEHLLRITDGSGRSSLGATAASTSSC
jgi:hypothetical protein